ncbi:hypothetical protein AH70_01610 [Pediococcus damnosus LMG 28219]|uniref:glycosyltransferase n=1 Tax=Pediococcus damnosus TaxID=51663 RepID=UPI00061F2182|nr:glycosyltransferase family 2 protein [Pediococcus damnosus]KJU73446.1 hypothetical protein AH70_01610 [Pediococcus damnosus LMG 28219]PIO86017.1 hypothetical protein BSQ37_08775 [Pediococcus damnosus]
MKCGIVILNYNSYKKTIQLIHNIEKQKVKDLNLQICIVDNNSQNNSYMILKKYLAKMKCVNKVYLLKSNSNQGYSAGNNIGIEYLMDKGVTSICICNNDIKFNSSFIQSGFQILNDSGSAIIAPQIVQGKRNIPPLYKRRPTFFSFVWRGPLLPLRKLTVLGYKPHKQYIYAMSGACFFIDIKIFNSVYLFDTNVFLYGEELILGEKLYKRKYKVLFYPDLRVYHEDSATTKKAITLDKRFEIMYQSLKYYLGEYRSDIPKSAIPIIIFLTRFERFYSKLKSSLFIRIFK